MIKRHLAVVMRASRELSGAAPLAELDRRAVCDQFIRNKGSKLSAKQILEEQNVKTPPLDSHFSCSICLGVVYDPIKRQDCEHMFCQTCSRSQKSKLDSCPQCRKSPFMVQDIGRFEQKRLNAVTFECPAC